MCDVTFLRNRYMPYCSAKRSVVQKSAGFLIGLLLCACASPQIRLTSLTTTKYEPTDPLKIRFYYTIPPSQPHEVIAVISVETISGTTPPVESLLRATAASVGGDAIVILDAKTYVSRSTGGGRNCSISTVSTSASIFAEVVKFRLESSPFKVR